MVVLPHISIPWHDGITHPHPVCRVQHTRDVGCAVGRASPPCRGSLAFGSDLLRVRFGGFDADLPSSQLRRETRVLAFLADGQLSLAIGKGGLNIRLSKMLTGYDIDVYREVEEEDVALTEFADEIDGWVIDALKAAGCDTAKSVLELPVEEIAARADLELEQAQKVVEILKAEFE